MLEFFKNSSLPMPLGICDNAKEKQANYIMGIPVLSFEEAYEKYPNLKILITSSFYGDEIETQVLEKSTSIRVLNIGKFPISENTALFSKASPEKQAQIIKVTDYLRGVHTNKDKFLRPEDIPEFSKNVNKTLSVYKQKYIERSNELVEVDNFYIKERQFTFADTLPITEQRVWKLTDFLNQHQFNGVYKVSSGGISSLITEINVNGLYCDQEKNIANFSEYLNNKDIPFLYVQLPNKLSTADEELTQGVFDLLNPRATELVENLKNNGVNVFDYREIMKLHNMNSLGCFFTTDHHWKPSTALHATQYICKRISQIIEFPYDKELFNQYETVTYPDLFLGSYGKITGLLYGGLDDFELILPKFRTNYSWLCENKGFFNQGEAKDVFVFSPHLDWNYFGVSPYATYSIVAKDCTVIKNHNATYEKKIICLCDSFSRPISEFISPYFSELYFFDIRQKLNKKDVLDKIEEVKPDIVVMAHWPTAIATELSVSDINPYT